MISKTKICKHLHKHYANIARTFANQVVTYKISCQMNQNDIISKTVNRTRVLYDDTFETPCRTGCNGQADGLQLTIDTKIVGQ